MKRREETSKGRGREVAWDAWLLLPGLGFLLGDMVCFWEKGPFVSALLYWAGVLLYPARSNDTVIAFRSLMMIAPCPQSPTQNPAQCTQHTCMVLVWILH